MAELHDLEVDQYLYDCVDIDPIALEEEFIRLPADLAYWNHQFADAVAQYQRAKFHREQVAARLHGECREALMTAAVEAAEDAEDAGKKAAKVKAPTVSDIESAVLQHEEYTGARELEVEKESEKARLYGVVDSVRTKRDMLIQMGANRRVEMQGDPILREEARAQREARGG